MTLDYKILATGSSGNAVRINNIMIDCGISFKRMKEELYKVDTLLITHGHKDHLNPQTYERIRKEFPRIKVYSNYDVAYRVPIDSVFGEQPFKLKRGNVTVYPHEGSHDVPVSTFAIDFDGTKVFYATDTSRVTNPEGFKFDAVFIEGNYDKKKLQEIARQYVRKGYDPVYQAHRHLSVQKAKAFYYGNRKDADTPYIELHQSSRFR